MKILFSQRPDWEPAIRQALCGSPHAIAFDDFASAPLHEYDVLVPLTIADLEILDAARHLASRNPLPIPNLTSVRLCDDKLVFNKTMRDHGLGEFIPEFGPSVPWPCVLKKRIDEAGAHTHFALGAEHARALLAGERESDYFRQRLVYGTREYTTHLVVAGGRVLYTLHIEVDFAEGACIKGRDPCLGARAVSAPCETSMFASMLATIGFEGLCCVNYKLERGVPRVFEINPRMGWNLCAHFAELIPLLEQRALGNVRYFIGRALHDLGGATLQLPL